jgi:hypothetical protein
MPVNGRARPVDRAGIVGTVLTEARSLVDRRGLAEW